MLESIKEGERPADVKALREVLLRFIRTQLQKLEGGEGSGIRALQLFLQPEEGEQALYEAALYLGEEGRFRREEVQRMADDFALDLPPDWAWEVKFTEALPPEAARAPGLPAALFIQTRRRSLPGAFRAQLQVVEGAAEKETYPLTPESGRVNIGREARVITAEGFLRINHVAFTAEGSEANKYVSRQHAHIEWDEGPALYLLFADEGGIPPRNKVKVRRADGSVEKLQSMEVGFALRPGDQIILGDKALLLFSGEEGQ